MTEKRFTGEWVNKYFKVCDNGEEMLYSEMVELLNMLHEENKKLDEKYIDEFSLRETLQQDLQRVEKENRQLKYQNERLQEELRQAKAVINKEWSKYLKQKEKEVNANE